MSGAGDSRPHEKLGTFDIKQRIRRLENWIRDYERDIEKLRRLGDIEEIEGKRSTIRMMYGEIDDFQKELTIREGRSGRGGPTSNLVSVACGCQRPRRFKLSGKVYDLGPIICGNCSKPFRLT